MIVDTRESAMSLQEKPDPWFSLSLKVGRGSQATRVQLQGGPALVSIVVALLFAFGYSDLGDLIQLLFKARG